MKRLLVLALVIVFITLAGQVLPAQAIATVDSYTPGCSYFFASGTTDAPYVVVEVYDPAVGEDIFYDSFPVSGDTFSVIAPYPAALPTGTYLEMWVWGSPTDDPDDWDGEAYFFTEEPCQVQPPGPGIPSGFVNHMIICDVAVYNGPAGTPVGSNRILNGQSWFVNTTPVAGADGAQWTEIFVGGQINAWIPTSCVGGLAPLT